MNPEQLLAHFDRVCVAPEAIPALRRFILDLAVRGRLVKQDPEDEPAAVLWKKIQANLNPNWKGGARSSPVGEGLSIKLPKTWVWSSIGSISHIEMGQSPSSEHYNKSGEGIPFYQGKADFGKRNPSPRYWCSRPTKVAIAGDVLISVRAPVGPTNVANEKCCIGRGLAGLRPHQGIDTEYFLICLKAFESLLAALGFGTTFVAINKKHLTEFTIPLPPFPEQHRIVAKVDELMALCDRLEAQLSIAQIKNRRLLEALLHQALEPALEEVSA